MMTINEEWLNQNSGRSYPFKENMLRRPMVNGVLVDDLALPNNVIVDMVLATNIDPTPAVYLSALSITKNTITAEVSSASSNEVLAVAVGHREIDAEYFSANFTGYGFHDDIRGSITFGRLSSELPRIPDGVYEFTDGETLIEPRCVRPSIPCVSGLYIKDAADGWQTVRLRGDVALVAGSNIRLDFNREENAIIINAVDNSDFSEHCTCEVTDNRQVVETINGISTRNVVIEGDGKCVSVTSSGGRIRITDVCSTPACGCAELTFLNQKASEISSALGKLENYADTLSVRITELKSVVNYTQFSK